MSNSNIAIQTRRLTPADAAIFHQLRLQGLAAEPLAFGASIAEEQELSPADIEARLVQHADRGVFGAFAGDAQGRVLVGVVALGRERQAKLAHKGLVWGVYVSPAARGMGAGRLLLEALIAFARNVPGLRQLNLVVYEGNTAAIKLYESLGFVRFGSEPNAIVVDGVAYKDLHMALPLGR